MVGDECLKWPFCSSLTWAAIAASSKAWSPQLTLPPRCQAPAMAGIRYCWFPVTVWVKSSAFIPCCSNTAANLYSFFELSTLQWQISKLFSRWFEHGRLEFVSSGVVLQPDPVSIVGHVQLEQFGHGQVKRLFRNAERTWSCQQAWWKVPILDLVTRKHHWVPVSGLESYHWFHN